MHKRFIAPRVMARQHAVLFDCFAELFFGTLLALDLPSARENL